MATEKLIGENKKRKKLGSSEQKMNGIVEVALSHNTQDKDMTSCAIKQCHSYVEMLANADTLLAPITR